MKYLYILLLNSILFTIGWVCSYNYQISNNKVKFEKRVVPSHKGTFNSKERDTIPVWDRFTKEEKEKGIYGFKLRK